MSPCAAVGPGSPRCKACTGAAPWRSPPPPPPPHLAPPAHWVAAKPCHPGGLYIFILFANLFQEHHYYVRLLAPLTSLFRPPLPLTLAATLPPTTAAAAAEVCWQAWWYADASALRPTLFLLCAVLLAHPRHCPLAPAPNTRVPRTAPLRIHPSPLLPPSMHSLFVSP